MITLDDFSTNVYSEELYAGISEADYNEVMQASAVDDGWQGYTEWSQELEQGQIVDTPHGPILYNRDCNHAACHTTRCERDVRVGGVAV